MGQLLMALFFPRQVFAGQRGVEGHADGPIKEAAMRRPSGLCVDPRGHCYLADTGNAAIRHIFSGRVETVQPVMEDDGATSEGQPTSVFCQPRGVAADDLHLFVAGSSRAIARACR